MIKKLLGMGTLNRILILLGLLLLAFTVAMIVVFVKYQSVPDTLIVSFFSACTGEAGICGVIRCNKNKLKGETNDWSDVG